MSTAPFRIGARPREIGTADEGRENVREAGAIITGHYKQLRLTIGHYSMRYNTYVHVIFAHSMGLVAMRSCGPANKG